MIKASKTKSDKVEPVGTSSDPSKRLGPPSVQQTALTESLVNAAAIYLYRQARFQPISYLNPETLSWQLTEWNVGTMRRFSLTMDAIENRDCVTKSVTGKLKQSLARRSFEIVEVEGAEESKCEAHAAALKDFYSNLECTNAVDRNVRGGWSTLIYQMMDAALKRYAAHEIIWKPIGNEADRLTATFVFVPLWFFENRTGSLRFCGNFAWDGIPLKDGNWMVTVGDGIMEAITVAWMYKTISLRDWLIYSEKHGMPGIVGKTTYQKDSPGWNAVRDAVEAVGRDFSAVVGVNDDITAVQFGQQGQLPYPPLVEYMDKAISALARGADLSTMSAAHHTQGQGASVQGDESDLLEQHYGQVITETLNHYVDPKIIKWHFGEGEEPCAYVKLNVPKRKDTALEIQTDQFLTDAGVKLGSANACERYGRTSATEEEIASGAILEKVAPPKDQCSVDSSGMQDGSQQPDEQATKASRIALNHTVCKVSKLAKNGMKPLQVKLRKILAMKNDEHYIAAVRALKHDLPDIVKNVDRTSENADALLDVNEVLMNPAIR